MATTATVMLVGWFSHIYRFGTAPDLAVGISASVLLGIFAFLIIATVALTAQRLPREWPLLMRVPLLVGLSAVLTVALALFQFAPAMLVRGWCQTTPLCADHLSSVFNYLLSAGRGILVLLLLPLITIPTVVVAHRSSAEHRAAQ